jgi:hypothetical protein
MNVSLNITGEIEQKLRAQAAASGTSVEDYVHALVTKATTLTASTETANQLANPELEEDDAAPWRGVFPLASERETIFTKSLDVRLDDLPMREPRIVFNPAWVDDDEE